MNYRLSNSVVLFRMCGEDFLFPSRKEGNLIPFIISLSSELASALRQEKTVCTENLSAEDCKKLQRLAKLRFVEEC